jgi:hypothetical protein
VYKYNASGVYQNVSFSVASEESDPTGIAVVDGYFWALDGGYQATDTVYKYADVNGIIANTSFGAHNYVRVK